MSDHPSGNDAAPLAKGRETTRADSPAPRRLPHPDECLPFRPAHKPLWAPRRKTIDPRQLDDFESSRRFNPRLTAASDLGQVRINFRYASFSPSFASFSEKAGRQQYFESHHEAFGYRLHEVDPSVVDLQYQPLTLSWTDLAGRTLSMTFDYAIEKDDGTVIVGEDKAERSYFMEPRLVARFAYAEAHLATVNVCFERREAGGIPSMIEKRAVKKLFDHRRTTITEDEISRAQRAIHCSGGQTPLSTVLDAIGSGPVLGEHKLAAMLHKRHVTFVPTQPLMPDTPVSVPRPAKPGALRSFLARHVPDTTSRRLH